EEQSASSTAAPATTATTTTTIGEVTPAGSASTTLAPPTTLEEETTSSVDLGDLKFALPSYVPPDGTYEDSGIDTDPIFEGVARIVKGDDTVALAYPNDGDIDLDTPDTLPVGDTQVEVARDDAGKVDSAQWTVDDAGVALFFVEPGSDDELTSLVSKIT